MPVPMLDYTDVHGKFLVNICQQMKFYGGNNYRTQPKVSRQ
jgi:hypothetical protein